MTNLELKRWHVFTSVGRKIVLAASSNEAQSKVESHGFKVTRVEYAPDPIKSLEPIRVGTFLSTIENALHRADEYLAHVDMARLMRMGRSEIDEAKRQEFSEAYEKAIEAIQRLRTKE